MTKSEFKLEAKKRNVIVYKVSKIKEKGNIGTKINFAYDYGNGTVSTEKTHVEWNASNDDVFTKFLNNQWAK